MNTNEPDCSKDCGGTVKQLISRLDDLEEQNQRLRERVDDLEQRLEDQDVRDDALSTKIDSTKDDVVDRIEDIEGRVSTIEDADPRSMDGENGVRDGEDDDDREDGPTTPLEFITRLPEHVARQELTANQERARFIAKDIAEYARKVPKGLRVGASTIKKVLRAKEGTTPHNQTVVRVMNFLDRFGKSDVSLKKRRGKRFVVFDRSVTDRYGTRDGNEGLEETDRAVDTAVVTALG